MTMPLSRTTITLLAIAALLAALLALPATRHAGQTDLPIISAVEPGAVDRISLVRAGQTTVIEREGEGWFLRQPLQAEADDASIRQVLQSFAKDVPVDLRIDEGNHEDYLLDDSNNIGLEIFTGGSEPAISLVMGKDLAGGSTVLRLPGSDTVYRARLGGRHRYDREATEWRNRILLDLEPSSVQALSLQSPAGTHTFTRDLLGVTEAEAEAEPGPWRLDGNPMFMVDQTTLDMMLASITRIRAAELHASDFGGDAWDLPAASAELVQSDGSIHHIDLIMAPDGSAALARVQDKPDVYRIAATWLRRFQWGLLEFRDKTVFDFSREQVDSIVLEEGGHRVRVQQDLGSKMWRVVEPVVMDADLRKTLYSVNALSDLRAQRVSEGAEPGAVGLDQPRTRFVVEFIDGSSQMLEVGHAFQEEHQSEAVYAWADGHLPIYEIKAETYHRLRQAFLKN
jgi:hypothetical protein